MAFENQSREEINAWIRAFHEGADALSTTSLPDFYAKDATLVFANNPPAVGIDNIVASLGGAFSILESMKHTTVDFDVVEEKLYLTTTITYVVKNDPKKEKFTVPAMGVGYFLQDGEDKGKMRRFEVYLDISAVFATVAEVAAAKA